MVRSPGLLDSTLSEVVRLQPTAGSLTVNMVGSSEAAITLPEGSPEIRIHDWISMYSQCGFVGIFRVSNISQDYKRQIDLALLHGIDILTDSVWAAQFDFKGTLTEYLTQLLDQQTSLINGQKPWKLGRCDDLGTYEKAVNYDRLSDLMEELVEDGGDYYFTYDQSTFPWTVNYVTKREGVDSEFRLARNVQSAVVTYNDAELCTRLHLSVNVQVTDTETETTSTETVIRSYDNSDAQRRWGLVVKTADIDTKDDIAAQRFDEADAWAQSFLSRRAEPSVQIQIDGEELYRMTGDPWDELTLGRLCQVALPAYGHTFFERVISVTYPDLLKEPDHVIVSLANVLPKFSEAIASIRKSAERANRSARGAARGAASAKELTTWSQHVKYYGEALDGTGILTLYESGIDMDAVDGVTIFSLREGLQSLYAGIKVNAEGITHLVRKSGVNSLGDNETLFTRINQNAEELTVQAARLDKQGEQIASAELKISSLDATVSAQAQKIDANTGAINQALLLIDGANATLNAQAKQIDAQGKQISAAELRMDGIAATLDLKVSKDGLIAAINLSPEDVTIQAKRINLSGYVTASNFNALKASFDNLVSGNTVASSIHATGIEVTNTLRAKSIVLAGKTMDYRVVSINGVTYNMVVVT